MKNRFNWTALGAFLGFTAGAAAVVASEKSELLADKYAPSVGEVYAGVLVVSTLAGSAVGSKISGRSEEQHPAPTVPTA